MVKDKKNAVLKSAEYLFATQGFDKTTVADIARECDVNEASIYSYFNSKRSILFAIYGKYLQQATKTLREHFLGMKEPGPKLRKTIWHYLSDMKNNHYYARINMMAQRENPDFYVSEYYEFLKDYSRLVLNVVITGQEENFFRPDLDPRLIRNMAMGTSMFTVYDSIVREYSYDPHEYSDIIYRLVVNAAGTENGILQKKAPMPVRTELRRSQIIETATRVFAAKGFSNATISEIARQANMGDATLYEYFENKEAILLGIPEVYLKDLMSSEDMRFQGLSSTEEKLRKCIWQWIWMLYSNDEFSRVLVMELLRNINFYSSPAYKFIESFQNKIKEVIENGQKEGLFIENVPFPAYFHMIMGTTDQYLLSHFLVKQPKLDLSSLNLLVHALVMAIRVREIS
ncbi:MAG: TetR/AcrR family transcriptional regulator [Deltaproteobacteria bacterium]|nr:TetR/AcrR family transcriptional regulator [Deltaproteobacteria bacterium]